MQRHLAQASFAILLLAATVPAQFAGDHRRIEIQPSTGAAFPLTVITPPDYSDETEHPVIFALPPGPGTTDMVYAFVNNYWEQEAANRGYVIVSPAVVGSGLESRGNEVLDAVFAWMDRNLSYDPHRVTLAGQSNGGLGAFYVARMQPERFATVIVMPGGYGGPGDLDRLEGKPVWMLVGERDTRWVQLSERTRDLLVLAGAEPTLEVLPGRGHVFPYSPGRLFEWIERRTPQP